MGDSSFRRNPIRSERIQRSFYSQNFLVIKVIDFLKPIRDLDKFVCNLIQALAIRKDATELLSEAILNYFIGSIRTQKTLTLR